MEMTNFTLYGHTHDLTLVTQDHFVSLHIHTNVHIYLEYVYWSKQYPGDI